MKRLWIQWAPLPLRLVLGLGMMQAGYPKLFVADGRSNIAYLIGELGLPFPELIGWIVGIIEFAGGFAILIGGLIAIASSLNALSILSLILLSMARGGIPAPLPKGAPFPDYPLAAVILAGMLTLWLGGAGTLSVDQLVGNRKLSQSRHPESPSDADRT